MSNKSAGNVTLETESMPGPGPQSMTIREGDQAWNELVDLIHRLNVPRWKDNYFDPCILDGRRWSLTVNIPGCRRVVTGMNACPNNFAKLEAWIEAHAS